MDFEEFKVKDLVYILPDKDAGVASVIRNLLRYKSIGYSTKVILLHNTLNNSNRRIKDDFNADSIVRINYNGKWSSKYSIYKKIINELHEDSTVVFNDGGLELNALSYLYHPISVAYVFHGNISHYYKVIQKHKSQIRTIITVSEFLKRKLDKLHPELDVISLKFPVPEAENLNRTNETSLIRLVFVGSLISDKGIFNLKSILNSLEIKKVPYSLNIIGSGAEEERLKSDLKAFNTVTFNGKLPNRDVLELHTNHDIILLPSKTEGLPVVIVEAMKYGVVPITTNLESGIPELIDHKVNGFTVPLGEIETYATYIEQLHQDRQLLDKMSFLNIEKANRLFDPITQAKQFEDAFFRTQAIDKFTKKSIFDYLPITVVHRLQSVLKK